MARDTEQSVIATGMLVGWIFALGIAVGMAVEKRERERRETLKRLDKLDPPPMRALPRYLGTLSLEDLYAAVERDSDLEEVGAHADR
jgi:hypothetical protein